MGASSEGEDRDLPGSRSRGLSTLWPRWRWLTILVLALAGFVGLWLTVTPEDVTVRWTQFGLGAAAVAGVMVSSRLPVLAVAVAAAATAGAWMLGATADPFVLVAFAVFRLAETRGGRRFPWWMFAGTIVVVVTSAIFDAEGAEDRFRGMLLSAVVLTVAWVLGVRTREVMREAAARSRAEERLRLARDVHDVLSHSLGAIGVQAGVAAHVTALGAEELRGVLRGIEGDARSSLSELKGFLQRERTDIEAGHRMSGPLSAALADVVRTAERAGVAVHLDADEAIDALPAGARTTVLRVVQEAVTNVLRHAGASSATVTLHTSSDPMTVRIEDDGQGVRGEIQPGHGLAGLRERVEILGGTVDFASSPAGFTVSAALPLGTRPSDGVRA